MRKQYGHSNAFTLIELLIVVAIIAILAAIAVPNFLEAQVRSKVSRAKADMRSVATAIEAYAVDYSKYPNSHQHWRLTTPVSFITALPIDPFQPLVAGDSGISNLATLYGSYEDIPGFFIYNGPNAFNPSGSGTNPSLARTYGIRWTLTCVGPDRGWVDDVGVSYSALAPVDKNPPYDTTNGTISRGNIERVGPGNTPDVMFRLIWRDN